MDKMVEERTQSAGSGDAAGASQTSQATSLTTTSQGAAGSVATMATMSTPRTGSFYIYTFDGRLLAEYDIYGNCLRDYIYMGSRLVAEFVPATQQYFYYTQDQIGSTRVVTNDTGTVVYAEAHDPYGGIQKTWVNDFNPKRKFSDKERDGETGLDYFGARYYSAPRSADGYSSGIYRWISVDPIIDKSAVIQKPQLWNLYVFCMNNPIMYRDMDGREEEAPADAASDSGPEDSSNFIDGFLAMIANWWKSTSMSHLVKGDLKGGAEIFLNDLGNALSDPMLVCSISGGLANTNTLHPGRLGGKLHRSMISDIKDLLEQTGLYVKREGRINIPKGGYKNIRFADLEVRGPGVKAFYIQVGKGLKSGSPVAREARAMADIARAEKLVFFIPYNVR